VKTFTDQLKRAVNIDFPPKRIISLVPSQTELLYDLGLKDEVVGITKFCIHPNEWFRNKKRIGGTKNVNIDNVKELNPDLIIANKEENSKDDVEALEQIAPVWISDISNLDEALEMIKVIGTIVNKEFEAKEIIEAIKIEFAKLEVFSNTKSITNKTCCYLIWQNPYMTIGANTFINDMLKCCGLQNIFSNLLRYPQVTIEEIIAANPSIVMLSSEPYPFKQKHIDELQKHLPNATIILVDGEMFSWYGSRMKKAPQYFMELLNMLG
jgi:ABC-type Fe3+-hydroxamate transport system substrate-binding protein